MDKQHISDNKFYIILVVAVLALIIGAAGLIVGLQRPTQNVPQLNGANQLPSGGTGDSETNGIDPSTGSGVVESPKKN